VNWTSPHLPAPRWHPTQLKADFPAPLRLIVITGALRSGTTILAELVGSCSSVLTVGELHNFWRAWAQNSPCSCGQPLHRCAVWSDAVRNALPGIDEDRANRLYLMGKSIIRNRNTMALTRSHRRGSRDGGLGEYLEATQRLLDAIAYTSGCRTIVDTSKSGSAIVLMSMLDLSRLDVVHLVRDLRGVAWSQMAHTHMNVAPELRPPRAALATTAMEWLYINLGIAHARRYCDLYTRLTYEGVFESPRTQFHLVCEALGLDDRTVMWSDDSRTVTLPPQHIVVGHSNSLDSRQSYLDNSRTVTLRPQHIVAGNPNRFESRQRNLTVDDDWRQKMPAVQRLALGPVAQFGRMLWATRRPRQEGGRAQDRRLPVESPADIGHPSRSPSNGASSPADQRTID